MTRRDVEGLAELVRILREGGATEITTEKSRSNHHKVRFVTAGGTRRMVVMANSPSDHRSVLNTIAAARRLLRHDPRPGMMQQAVENMRRGMR